METTNQTHVASNLLAERFWVCTGTPTPNHLANNVDQELKVIYFILFIFLYFFICYNLFILIIISYLIFIILYFFIIFLFYFTILFI